MNSAKWKKRCGVCVMLLIAGTSRSGAQSPGSVSTYGGAGSVKSISAGGSSADVSESLNIGPGMHIINGTWVIFAKYVIIDPTAVITGSGVIQFRNPLEAGGAAGPTLVDGNAAPAAAQKIDVRIQHLNPEGMVLANRSFDAGLVSAGWMNNDSSSTLYLGKDISLDTNGADIRLDTSIRGDLRLSDTATISNYRPERMIITGDKILSHMVKENFSSAFTFPVGIADGDYTPAQISNTAGNTVRVGVQSYTASASIEQTADPGPNGVPSDGMNRSWHIYADTAGIGSSLTLQHNSTTNQSGFTESSHFVTQYGPAAPNNSGDNAVGFGTSRWQSNTAGAGATGTLLTGAVSLAGSSMRSRSYDSLATTSSSDRSYFSKSADPFHPLPVQLIRFTAQANGCAVRIDWQTGVQKDVAYYRLAYSQDGKVFGTIAQMLPAAVNNYHYRHEETGEGRHYYRLQVHDRDGSVHYGPVAMVQVSCESISSNIHVYPNPAADLLIVDGLDPLTPVTLRLLNTDGKAVLEQQSSAARAGLRLGHLPPAAYTLQLIEKGSIRNNLKVVKQ